MKYRKGKFGLDKLISNPNTSVGVGLASSAIDALDAGNEYGRKSSGTMIASSALQGASMGMSFGPIGAGAGAILGGAYGAITSSAQKKQEDEMKRQMEYNDKLLAGKRTSALFSANPELERGSSSATYYALGGDLDDSPNVRVVNGKPASKSLLERLKDSKVISLFDEPHKSFMGMLTGTHDTYSNILKSKRNSGYFKTLDDINPAIVNTIGTAGDLVLDPLNAIPFSKAKYLKGLDGLVKIPLSGIKKLGNTINVMDKVNDGINIIDSANNIDKKANGGAVEMSNLKTVGGNIVPLTNEDSYVQGRSHAEGGVKIPSQKVELEGKETMNNDFVFSKQLGFADRHLDLVNRKQKLEEKKSKFPDLDIDKSIAHINNRIEGLKVEQETLKHNLGIPNNLSEMASGGSIFDLEEFAKRDYELPSIKITDTTLDLGDNPVSQELNVPSTSDWAKSISNKGDSIAISHNNPRNMKFASWMSQYGATRGRAGKDGGVFAHFPTVEAGIEASKHLLTKRGIYNNLSVNDALKKWSNNGYDGKIVPSLSGKKINELNDSQLNYLMKEQIRHEDGKMYNILYGKKQLGGKLYNSYAMGGYIKMKEGGISPILTSVGQNRVELGKTLSYYKSKFNSILPKYKTVAEAKKANASMEEINKIYQKQDALKSLRGVEKAIGDRSKIDNTLNSINSKYQKVQNPTPEYRKTNYDLPPKKSFMDKVNNFGSEEFKAEYRKKYGKEAPKTEINYPLGRATIDAEIDRDNNRIQGTTSLANTVGKNIGNFTLGKNSDARGKGSMLDKMASGFDTPDSQTRKYNPVKPEEGKKGFKDAFVNAMKGLSSDQLKTRTEVTRKPYHDNGKPFIRSPFPQKQLFDLSGGLNKEPKTVDRGMLPEVKVTAKKYEHYTDMPRVSNRKPKPASNPVVAQTKSKETSNPSLAGGDRFNVMSTLTNPVVNTPTTKGLTNNDLLGVKDDLAKAEDAKIKAGTTPLESKKVKPLSTGMKVSDALSIFGDNAVGMLRQYPKVPNPVLTSEVQLTNPSFDANYARNNQDYRNSLMGLGNLGSAQRQAVAGNLLSSKLRANNDIAQMENNTKVQTLNQQNQINAGIRQQNNALTNQFNMDNAERSLAIGNARQGYLADAMTKLGQYQQDNRRNNLDLAKTYVSTLALDNGVRKKLIGDTGLSDILDAGKNTLLGSFGRQALGGKLKMGGKLKGKKC